MSNFAEIKKDGHVMLFRVVSEPIEYIHRNMMRIETNGDGLEYLWDAFSKGKNVVIRVIEKGNVYMSDTVINNFELVSQTELKIMWYDPADEDNEAYINYRKKKTMKKKPLITFENKSFRPVHIQTDSDGEGGLKVFINGEEYIKKT